MNFRFPIFLDLTGKNCLVVGEGYEIPAKVRALLDASARVTYINRQADAALAELAESGLIEWRRRDFEPADLDGRFLVIADSDHNEQIFCIAEERNILCNAVDDPAHCRFSFGSIHRQGDLTIAISTNGWAPAVAVRLRERFEREIGPEFGGLLELLQRVRPEVISRVRDFATRRELWYKIVDSEVLDVLRDGDRAAAEALIRGAIEQSVSSTSASDICGDTSDR